jgi:hypothetical protein
MCLREAMAMKIRLTVQVVELQLTSAQRRSTRAHNLTIRALLRLMAEENHATMRSLMAKISTAGASSRIMVIGSRSRLMVKMMKPRSTVGSMESSSGYAIVIQVMSSSLQGAMENNRNKSGEGSRVRDLYPAMVVHITSTTESSRKGTGEDEGKVNILQSICRRRMHLSAPPTGKTGHNHCSSVKKVLISKQDLGRECFCCC